MYVKRCKYGGTVGTNRGISASKKKKKLEQRMWAKHQNYVIQRLKWAHIYFIFSVYIIVNTFPALRMYYFRGFQGIYFFCYENLMAISMALPRLPGQPRGGKGNARAPTPTWIEATHVHFDAQFQTHRVRWNTAVGRGTIFHSIPLDRLESCSFQATLSSTCLMLERLQSLIIIKNFMSWSLRENIIWKKYYPRHRYQPGKWPFAQLWPISLVRGNGMEFTAYG